MRAEIESLVNEMKQSLELLRRHLDYDQAVLRLEELNHLAEEPTLWDDAKKAQAVMRERTQLEASIKSVDQVAEGIDDNVELIELGEMEDDGDIVTEAETALQELQTHVAKAELETLLSGEADSNDTYLEIHAGAGGTEAQDWALMLLRMYSRWAEQHDYKLEVLEESPGEEAGIKSTTLRISGHNAYGWLKTESGVHRLVRISPFDSNARRHTSFTSVGVYPSIDEDIDVDVEDKDIRVDTYRASGAGGQHINKTDSAVRMTHIPTGIVVQCQNDRSQHKNRANAMSMLKARLYEMELQRREDATKAEHDAKTDIGWGHQIRSYVLQPYQMIKDLRTNKETSNTSAFLDGDLDDFLAASLAARVAGNKDESS
ncbi:MAG: peptide chain release factor 2 [Alphaproteobacteria bacterium]|nr:peptide chain release factor 2 [Alphaproteobacteria bacterium]